MVISVLLDILYNKIERDNKHDEEPITQLKEWATQNFLNNTRFQQNIDRLNHLQSKGWKIIIGDIINGHLKIILIKDDITKEQAKEEIESVKLLDTSISINDIMDLLSGDIDICY